MERMWLPALGRWFSPPPRSRTPAPPYVKYNESDDLPRFCRQAGERPSILSGCDRVVEIQHSERWAGIPIILNLMATTGMAYGFRVANPHVMGGSLVESRRGIPLSIYFKVGTETCGVAGRPTIPLVFRRQPFDPASKLPPPRWCEHGRAICIFDWTPCYKGRHDWACPAYKTTPKGLMGLVISQAFHLVERDCEGTWATLSLPRDGLWYRNHAFNPRANKSNGFQSLSPGMELVASHFAALHMRCPQGKEISAMLRIAYQPMFRQPVRYILDNCEKTLITLNSLSNALQPRKEQVCPHFLASDFFVMADGNMPKPHNEALHHCLRYLEQNVTSSSYWTSMGRSHIMRALVGMPSSIVRAHDQDQAGFRAILEVAMLARSDVCFEKSHLGTLASMVRMHTGKPSCQHIVPVK